MSQTIEENKLDKITSCFNTLDIDERNTLFNRPNLVRFSQSAKSVYQWICSMIEKGRYEFSIPAMLIPAILGMEFESKDSRHDFIRLFLKTHGKENFDWKKIKKSNFFNFGGYSEIEFKAPNDPTKV